MISPEAEAEYKEIIKQIVDQSPLDQGMVLKHAALNPEQAEEIYERALAQNSAQVDLWEAYLKHQMN